MSKVIEEIRGGNGNHFTLKEMMQEHIRHQCKFEERMISSVFNNTKRSVKTETGLYYIKWIVGSLFVIIIGLIPLII